MHVALCFVTSKYYQSLSFAILALKSYTCSFTHQLTSGLYHSVMKIKHRWLAYSFRYSLSHNPKPSRLWKKNVQNMLQKLCYMEKSHLCRESKTLSLWVFIKLYKVCVCSTSSSYTRVCKSNGIFGLLEIYIRFLAQHPTIMKN